MSAEFLTDVPHNRRLSAQEALALIDYPLEPLMRAAACRRDAAHGPLVSYSRKVFIPLTQLCRDVCHYCTFAHPPRRGEAAYLSPRAGARDRARRAGGGLQGGTLHARRQAGAALPRGARTSSERLGHQTTLSYLAAMAKLVLEQTGLLPHVNPGVLESRGHERTSRTVSVSQGIMLESTADRLCARGGPHFGSPDKRPAAPARRRSGRAGEAAVPFTSGILIGIGETRAGAHRGAPRTARPQRCATGTSRRSSSRTSGRSRRRGWPATSAPSLEEHLWTIADDAAPVSSPR